MTGQAEGGFSKAEEVKGRGDVEDIGKDIEGDGQNQDDIKGKGTIIDKKQKIVQELKEDKKESIFNVRAKAFKRHFEEVQENFGKAEEICNVFVDS